MRNVILVILLVFGFFSIYAQSFEKLIGNSNDNRAGKSIQLANHLYLLGRNGTKATVTKLDLNGNHIWTNETNDEAFWWDIIANKDGNLMVVGGLGSNSGNTTNNFSLCGVINAANGNFIVLKTFNIGFKELFFKIYKNPSPANNSFPYYVTAIKTISSGSNNDDLELLTFDDNFNMNQRSSYSLPGVDEEIFRDIMVNGTNGTFMTIGNKSDTISSAATLSFDKNLTVIGTRNFTQQIIFMSGLSKQTLNSYEQILAGGTTDGTQDAIILKVNGFNLIYSYKIPEINRIFKIAFGDNGRIYVVGNTSIGGIDKTVIASFQDNNSSLTVNWAKILDQNETAFSNGYIDFLTTNKYVFSDSRNGNILGSGNFDMLLCVENAVFDNCLDKPHSITLQNNPMNITEFNITSTRLLTLPSTNRTGSLITYSSNDICAPPCNITLQVTKSVDACSNATFTGIASGGTGPYAYQWDISCNGVNGTTNPYTTPIGSGTIPFCVTVTDAVGCSRVLTNQTVVGVRDLVKPVFICPDDVQLTNNPGQCYGAFAPVITVTDNCDPAPVCNCIMTGSTSGNMPKNTLVQFNVGTTTVTCTATDASGNVSVPCSFTVNVIDAQPPSIVCPSNITLSCDQNEDDYSITGQATANDNCPEVIISHTDAYSGNGCAGAITRTWKATDASGAMKTCIQLIIIEDKIAPAISCPAPITINCDQQPFPSLTGMPQAVDNCQPNIIPIYIDNIVGTGCTRFIQRMWSANDGCGNISTCVQTIHFRDQIAPVAVCPPNITINCQPTDWMTANFGTATGTDNCGSVTISNFNRNFTGTNCNGEIKSWWRATDACGIQNECFQTITIKDNVAPIIMCPANITVACNGSIVPATTGQATATDNCQSSITIDYSDIKSGTICDSIITRTWTASDGCGNTSTCTQTIIKTDDIFLNIQCPNNITISCDQNANPGIIGNPIINGNCPGTITIMFSDAKIGTACDTTIIRTWTASDGCNNTSTCVQTIVKIDNIAPVLSCPANITIACNSSTIPETLGQATATDNCQSSITIDYSDIKSGTICDSIISRTWTASDGCNNTSTCVQTIVKIDNIAPVLSCPANITIACNASTIPATTGQATATDNCQSSITINYSDVKSGTICDSIITRTWTASDGCNNTSTCVQTILKRDDVAPVLSCPANITIACNSSTVPATTGQATATDNCQSSITIDYTDVKSGTVCDTTIMRTWTASNGCNNTSTCVQTIVKTDNVAPVLSCPANITIACNASTLPATTGQATATDNCQSSITLDYSDVKSGTICDSIITRTWTAFDGCGNISTCVQTIVKIDNIAPFLSCPANITIACNASTIPATTGQATATDNCQSSIIIDYSDIKSGTICDSIITRTWTASDGCGNTSTCVQTIVKKGDIFLNIQCPNNITITCDQNANPGIIGNPIINGNCPGTITIMFSDTKIGTACDTTIIRTWTASDGCNNTSTCVQTIVKTDNVAPFLSCPANITIACNASTIPATTGQATATDNCQSSITLDYSDIKSGTICDSIITRTWTASDGCNNTSTCLQTIVKTDNVAPVLSCPANITIACNASTILATTGQATATDNCQSSITIDYSDIKSGNICDSIINRTWTASDGCGNTSTCVQTIVKTDNVAPVLSCPANITIACNSSIIPATTGQATATDNCQSSITINYSDVKSGTICDSIITRTWTASDGCNNTSTCVQTIVKTDNVAPVLSCPANITVACNASTVSATTGQATATDNCQSLLTIDYSDVKSGTACDTTIIRTWTASDGCNNTSTCVQIIVKTDNVAPVLSCPANITIACNASTLPATTGQATATDNCQSSIIIDYSDVKSGTICDSIITRTWTASDGCNNTSTCVQTIVKTDNVAPVLYCPADITIACNVSTVPITTGLANATDNCQSSITIEYTDVKSGTACDTTIIRTWTASDGCNNTSTCVQFIVKTDNVAPFLSCPSNITIACNASTIPATTGQATATDNCQSSITIDYSDVKSGTACDTTIMRTWAASDGCGNTSTCVQTIVKTDNEAPVLSCPANITIACNSSTVPATTGQATATDNCQSSIIIDYSDVKLGTACDTTIMRTWTASDGCNNTSTCVQTIVKTDNVAPIISCPTDITIACNASTLPANTGQATATDNCQSSITIDYSDVKSGTACDSIITRTWIASDGCGNLDTCTQTIIKKDTLSNICCNQASLDSLISKSFNIIANGCQITISANQFSDCHFLKQSPDFGDGKDIIVDLIPANGVWAHDYDTSGTYIICLDVISKDQNGNICVSGQACKTIDVFCDVEPVSCCSTSGFFENSNINVSAKACDLCLSYNQKDSCDILSVNFGAGFQAWIDKEICQTYPDTGSYEVCIKSERFDLFGNVCFERDSCFTIKISCDENEFCVLGDIIVPNGITPNGDGFNDQLIINTTNDCKSFDVSIYNRWGQLVYIKSRYDGEWNGQSNNGSQLPDGTYYLILSLPKPSTEKRSFKTFVDLRTK